MTPVDEGQHVDSAIAGRLTVLIVLALVLVLQQGWLMFRGVASQKQQWEYTISGPTDDELQGRLQQLGVAGWELVSARRATSEVNGRTAGMYEMIFRRPFDPSTPPQLAPATKP